MIQNLNLQNLQYSQLFLMTKVPPTEKQKPFDREQQRIYQILTNKILYKPNIFTEEDLSPDLVIKISLPKSQYIPMTKYLQLSNYVAFPSQKLERAFQKGEKQIISEMNKNKQNTDPSNLQIRLQKALVPTPLSIKKSTFINQHEQQQTIELQSVYQHNGALDSFGLQYNAIIYILQAICGFRLRAFLLYDEQQQNQDIYLFLTLNTQNCINLAKKYRIKKQIDYSFIDFFLNDPSGNDSRPIKYSSAIKPDTFLSKQLKQMNRYFKIHNNQHQNCDLIQQKQLSDQEKNNFRDYMEGLQQLYGYFKYIKKKQITNQQKAYLYNFNRHKLNKGCQKLFSIVKQRRQFFQLNKALLSKYGYKYTDQPLIYRQFSLPEKSSSGMSFFQHLYSLLIYKPQVISAKEDLDLFLSMEKTKLSYLSIKHHFKINYLKKIGFDFFSITNNFEKFGVEKGEVKGGINGKNLEQNWSIYAINSNIDTIRNYVGDIIGLQIFLKKYLIIFFLTILVPFGLLFIIQLIYGAFIYLYTTIAECLIYTISFQFFIHFWQQEENEYLQNYSDEKSSKIFLSTYRGPYKRNILTDEINEFQKDTDWNSFLVNSICVLLISALLVLMGAVFYGCRMLLLGLYDPLSSFVTNFISLPHIISYLFFFFFANSVAVILTDRIISSLVKLKNPPTDEDEADWKHTLTFFYLTGLELIPPFFFFILEPFNGTSCFANECIDEIQFYVYSRMIITFIVSLIKLAHVFIFRYLHAKDFKKRDPPAIYQSKLAGLLTKAVKESKKIEYTPDNNEAIIVIISFATYCNVLPIISFLALIAIFIHFTNTRLALLYQSRRPINRSEKVRSLTNNIKIIFYIGIFSQAWVSIFLLNFVQIRFQGLIKAVSTEITYQGIFLLKFTIVCLEVVIMYLLALGAQDIISGYTSNALLKRKKYKFKSYIQNRGGLKLSQKKAYQPTPLTSVFRTFNRQNLDHQSLFKQLYTLRHFQYDNENRQNESEAAMSIKALR